MSENGRKLFVGLRVSVACANTLAAAAETLVRRAREAGVAVSWVPAVNFHVTLKYLGWTREPAMSALGDVLAAAVADTPELKFRAARVGAFPAIERATVLWAGIEAPGATVLGALAAKIEAATTAIGFAAFDHPFHPHVTLGRLRDPKPVRELILPVSEQMFSESRADAVILFESETKSSGSVYKEIARIPFKTPSESRISSAERQTQTVQLGATNAAVPRSSPADLDDSHETDDGWPRGHGP